MHTYFLLFSTLLLFVVSLSADIRIADLAGNLTGDTKRGYVDITEIIIRQKTASLIVEITVDQPFPDASLLLGTGMEFGLRFLDADKETSTIFNCNLELNDQGWTIIRPGGDTEPLSIDFSVNPTAVALEIPSLMLGDSNRLEIVADTANRPKWRPVTANPTIIVELPPPPLRPETASH